MSSRENKTIQTHPKADRFYQELAQFQKPVSQIRQLLLESMLKEDFKWKFPTYTLGDKNVLSVGVFKNHFGIWFFQGALLKDEGENLTNAQEGKTQAMRQWRFQEKDQLDLSLIQDYVSEAISLQKQGISVPRKKIKPLKLPMDMKNWLEENVQIREAFRQMTQGKKNEYIQYIDGAKLEKTRQARMQKIAPMIIRNEGINDKYRK